MCAGTFLGRPHLMFGLIPVRPCNPKEDGMKVHLMALALGAALTMPALAADQVEKAPPSGAYKKASELVKLPDFLPGIGQLYVDRKTLPAGPFLAYDRDGKLISTVYMIPTEDISAQKKFDDLAAPGERGDARPWHDRLGAVLEAAVSDLAGDDAPTSQGRLRGEV